MDYFKLQHPIDLRLSLAKSLRRLGRGDAEGAIVELEAWIVARRHNGGAPAMDGKFSERLVRELLATARAVRGKPCPCCGLRHGSKIPRDEI